MIDVPLEKRIQVAQASLEIEKDIKNKLHNWVITPLIADTKNIIKVTNTKK